MSIVGSEEHQELAMEVARRSITLVRDDVGTLPIHLESDKRILAVMPRPLDLTPADTSSLQEPLLAQSIREIHPATSELIVEFDPGDGQIASSVEEARNHDLIIIDTIDANPRQAQLVDAMLATGIPTVVVAMRTPYDLSRFHQAPTYVCSYGILPPTMKALAQALFNGEMMGKLPAAIPGLYPVGHSAERNG
jgi:beta-N-acetylhexosaminidase